LLTCVAAAGKAMGYVLPFEERIALMTYYYFKDHKGEWRWHLKATSGRVIADSGEGYKDENECLDDIDRVKASKDVRVERQSSVAQDV
jgi:uncharacterized protein YegP (UPF0339 family)